MRQMSALQWGIWRSGDYLAHPPTTRVTIAIPEVREIASGRSVFRTPFGTGGNRPTELDNLKSLSINRDTDNGVAVATMVFYNSREQGAGAASEYKEIDSPGFYTPGRGTSAYSGQWSHQLNPFHDIFVPDRLIKTFQGYGVDYTIAPERDPHLVQTGEWWIETVELSHDGLIEVRCRDRAGPGLADQIAFPPVVPLADYPLTFTQYERIARPSTPPSAQYSTTRLSYRADSNVPYVGVGGAILGHRGRDAFDGQPASFWQSVGNSGPRHSFAYEWVEGGCAAQTIRRVTVNPWAGNYVVYISVHSGGAWQGAQVVPYDPNAPASAPNGANIPYVLRSTIGFEKPQTFDLGRDYPGVTRVRVTLHNLYYSGVGPFRYRGGIREVTVDSRKGAASGAVAVTYDEVGNYTDYSDIVKLCLGWGGFWWTQRGAVRQSDGSTRRYVYDRPDPYLDGRIWGDIEKVGTAGPSPLGPDVWDKKPLLDCVKYVQDIVGYTFFVDELGAAVFRTPNIYSIGNYLSYSDVAYTRFVPEISEKVTLLGYTATLSKRNSRHRVFVGDASGTVGAAVDGREPYPVGWKRVAGWTDQRFASDVPGEAEATCRVMADLITVRQLMTFREGRVTIQGFPAFQLDDQVRIFERVTEETNLHYIKSITSDYDAETREWTMTLGTHWLGEATFDKWAFSPQELSVDTRDFLSAGNAGLERTARSEAQSQMRIQLALEDGTTQDLK